MPTILKCITFHQAAHAKCIISIFFVLISERFPITHLTSGGSLALFFSNLPYFILHGKNKRLSFQMNIPGFTLLPVQGSWAEANMLASVSHALAFSEYPSALGCCNPSCRSLKPFYWLAEAAATGLIYGPWVGCRSEVSAAFDGLITSEGESGTSWQQKKKKSKRGSRVGDRDGVHVWYQEEPGGSARIL